MNPTASVGEMDNYYTNSNTAHLRSPMKLPAESECYKCSLLCEIQFKYPKTVNWQMNAVSILYDPPKDDAAATASLTHHRLLRFYVTNTTTDRREDVEYNGRMYQLEFIEFYAPGLHQLPLVAEDGAPTKATKYDAEMVMCHRSHDSGYTSNKPAHWLNVSVPIHSMYTYSLSQDFFYQLISSVCSGSTSAVPLNTTKGEGTVVKVDTGKEVRYGTLVAVSLSGYDPAKGGAYPYYLPTKLNVKVTFGGQSPQYHKILITGFLRINKATLDSSQQSRLRAPQYPFNDDLNKLNQELKSVPLYFAEDHKVQTSQYSCMIESYDETSGIASKNKPHYFVRFAETDDPKQYPERTVTAMSTVGTCPWRPQSGADTIPHNNVPRVTSRTPTVDANQVCTPSTQTGDDTRVYNQCASITVDNHWNPYQGLPYSKALYIYGGMFPYAPGLYGEGDQVTWVVMKNPVPMHTSEYETLLALIKPPSVHAQSEVAQRFDAHGFMYNVGTLYTPAPALGRPVYFNDGGTIQHDADQEKFYIKCAKKADAESREAVTASIASGTALDTDLAAIGGQHSPVEYQASALSFYRPPQSTVSTIVVCFVLSFLLFALFAVCHYNRPGSGGEGGGGEGDGSLYETKSFANMMFAFVCVGIFVMYGLSFVAASKVSAGALFYGAFGAAALVVTNMFGGWLEYALESRPMVAKYLYRALYGVVAAGMFVAVVVLPVAGYTFTVTQDRSFYYTNPSEDDLLNGWWWSFNGYNDVQIYIGTRPAIDVHFAGYELQYRNEYTMSQTYQNLRVPNKKGWDPSKIDTTTDTGTSSPLEDPNNQFFPISSTFWTASDESILVPVSAPTEASMTTDDGTDNNGDDEDDVRSQTIRTNIEYLVTILIDYDARMKSGQMDPYTAFVQAVVHKTGSMPTTGATSADDVNRILSMNHPSLYRYLHRQSVNYSHA
jgi:hypothetical protein